MLTSKLQPSPVVHRTTPAEQMLMAVIRSRVSSLPKQSAFCVDYDFIRDFTIQLLAEHYHDTGERAYIDMACTCVGVHRCHFKRNNIKNLTFF